MMKKKTWTIQKEMLQFVLFVQWEYEDNKYT